MQITFDALRHKNVSEAIASDRPRREAPTTSPSPCDNQMETWHGMSRFRDHRRALPGDRFSESSAQLSFNASEWPLMMRSIYVYLYCALWYSDCD